ncbi:MAG: Co2+/Mg2+ efflux protein ApaG [Phycisphaerales bacterium]
MTTKAARSSHGSEALTEGIRVTAAPMYLSAQSDPSSNKFVFSYDITIANEGDRRAKLVTRHWEIVDANGERHDVHGPGVVGQTPDIAPGERFEYSSFCPLTTPWGTMEGTYEFEREDGSTFQAIVARFYLVSGR